ncbi:hypothetical protein [Muriicola soli]|uniref:DUF4175 family protein n=1 Tax=Muriicola soli TaxID=2507538 RepID=A0A411ECL8_9FLAO|nr:hypothetical protein [Muriicola soli]QBA65378.1 hypothetical protein EQY75_13055 [Muriicola soli]
MKSYDNILQKLAVFVRKYYKTQILKGGFLFLVLALIFWMVLLTIEYFLWMGSSLRTVVFVLAITTTIFLFVKYIGNPLLSLFKLRRGLDLRNAAEIIGNHFPQVGDRLLNLLELAEDKQRTELLLASIEQRSDELSPIPFQQAIDIKKGLKYAKYLTIPVLLLGIVWITGKMEEFLDSYNRVVNYDLAYEKPAPFKFLVLNNQLKTIEKQDITILVMTEGEVKPELAYIVVDGKKRLMQESNGQYNYTFNAPQGAQEFYFTANGVRSRAYTLETIAAPSILQFYSILDYPKYINRTSDTLLGTGNAIVPEGTNVKWVIKGENTNNIKLVTADTSYSFIKNQNNFQFNRSLKADLDYRVTTSNEELKDYESLNYSIRVVKDQAPTINVLEIRDTIDNSVSYQGIANDDYELTKLYIVYYKKGEEMNPNRLELDQIESKDYEFYYDFPTGLDLEKGSTYNYYFRVIDNDALRSGKAAQSRVFSTSILNDDQEIRRKLGEQKEVIDNLDKGIEEMDKQEEMLKAIEQNQREKSNLNYNDKKEIKDFLQAQQQQEALMKKFSRQLQETMDKNKESNVVDELLKERLERQELEAKKNEKLLKELSELAEKIDKEELAKKLDELGKRQQNSKRNLSQLLELTKKYYVTEKANQLAKDLKELSEKQELLPRLKQEQDYNTEEQKKINEDFDGLAQELEELRKANSDLQKPLSIDTSEEKEKEVKSDLQEAIEELKKEKGEEEASDGSEMEQAGDKAKKKQRSAATKMKQMSDALQQSAMSGGASTMAEDAEMLRQILDNLVVFSFKQEGLLDQLSSNDQQRGYFTNVVKEEQELKKLFEHVDDSLFTLSLRQVEIAEFVNEQITEVYYNIDQSLESLSEGQNYQGASYQQYVLTAANNLADFLANVLNNMQQSLGQGQGKGNPQDGFQLPDIIKEQQGIKDSMNAKKEGEEGKEGEKGKDGKEGEGENELKGEGEELEGKAAEGNGFGYDDQEMKEIYEIYKQQQLIRQKLEEQLKTLIVNEDRELAARLAKQMEDFEKDLIENGITERTIEKANRIQQQLLKLENAAMEQGEKEERESKVGSEEADRPLILKRVDFIEEEGIDELLRRQVLPLQEFYKTRAKQYFRKDD